MILDLLFSFIGVALNPIGWFAFLFGLVAFVVAPLVYRITGQGRVFVGLQLWLVARLMQRAAIVISEHNDIFLKTMQFDDIGVETITFGDERKEFEDPDGALHTLKGMTFALADEVSGVLFDPRHAALGARKRESMERSELEVETTDKTWSEKGIRRWVKGIFEMPDTHELVKLSDVRYLINGGERSEHPQRGEELYKNSRFPLSEGSSVTSAMQPVIAFLVTFGGIWVILDQFAPTGGGGGGGGNSSVSFGFALLLVGGRSLRDWIAESDIDWWRGLKALLLVTVPIGVLSAGVVFIGPLLTAFLTVIILWGFLFLPVLGLVGRALWGPTFATLFLILGFAGYDRPVIKWTPQEYVIREFATLSDSAQDHTEWYGLANSIVGITYEPGPESWGAEVMPTSEVESKQMDSIDWDTNIPTGYVPMNMTNRGGKAAFGPKRTSSDKYYLHSGIACQRFEDSSKGQKTIKRLGKAKEEYGEDGFGIDGKALMYANIGAAAFGLIGGLGVWFLL